MNNSIFVIKPYKWEGMWVFDDPKLGLVKEPFVGGADTQGPRVQFPRG
jgi:putative methionine-R-sulfoxide reductase with GAF domain